MNNNSSKKEKKKKYLGSPFKPWYSPILCPERDGDILLNEEVFSPSLTRQLAGAAKEGNDPKNGGLMANMRADVEALLNSEKEREELREKLELDDYEWRNRNRDWKKRPLLGGKRRCLNDDARGLLSSAALLPPGGSNKYTDDRRPKSAAVQCFERLELKEFVITIIMF